MPLPVHQEVYTSLHAWAQTGFPRSLKPPHNPGMVMTGAAMLWVGWFGFNGGSAAAADTSAGMAMLVTHLSAATASLVWMLVEWRKNRKAWSRGYCYWNDCRFGNHYPSLR